MSTFDDVGTAETVVWDMRLADFDRGENRAILNRLFNGEPPLTREEAEENQNQVNRNFLEGTNLLSQARSQWNNAFLKQGNYFNVSLNAGPIYKRQEWSHIITKHINRQLKRSRQQMEQVRSEGAQVVLHGIAPSTFSDRNNPIPTSLPIASWLTPSETDCDLGNLEYQAFFREYTPYQLYQLTHGPKVDPGWNMKAVDEAWNYIKDQLQKEPAASNYQFMPERIEELKKQDSGIWGSDAVPTIDCWDLSFRNAKDGDGWYRRIFMDWGVGVESRDSARPDSKNKTKDDRYKGFLYNSGKRKYANSLAEITQCQLGDCSAVAPFKLHSTRSLAWLLWGICDISNLMHCRFTENVFMQFLWWFRCAGQNDFARVKKAMFENMGVIPAGISMIPAQERFKPDAGLVEMAFAQNKKMMSENSAAYTNDTEGVGNEETATATMAKLHSVNALVGGMMTLAYEYSSYKYQEQARRFCLPNNPYKMVKDFRLDCLKDGVPPELLDHQKWDIEPERALGNGNKAISMAAVQFMQGIRKNLGPDSQRKVDFLSLLEVLDQPKLAEDLAPIQGQKRLSPSSHDAQLSSDRILRGLTFMPSPEMVPEDYVQVWLGDMGTVIQQIQSSGGVGDNDKLQGLANLGQHVQQFLTMMESNEDEKEKVKQYADILGKMMNHVKGFAQRLQQQGQQNGNGVDPESMIKVQTAKQLGDIKKQNMIQSHAIRTGQHQAQFELQQANEDRKTNADIRREDARARLELTHDAAKKVLDLRHSDMKSLKE